MRPVPLSNPPNPWSSTEVEYLGDPPAEGLVVYEDHTRSILATNDSPDVGFKWSVNPYRGCTHACSYCVDGATRVLLGDGRTRPIAELRSGDEIYGTTFDGRYRRYARTRVLDHWETVKPAYRVTLSDGTELVASGDHRFASRRGWKHVTGAEQGAARRPHLTTNDLLMGTGRFADPPARDEQYRRGYLCGLLRGDATLRRYDYSARRGRREVIHQFRLALADLEALERAADYLAELEVPTSAFLFQAASGERRAMHAIRASTRAAFDRITDVMAVPFDPSDEWHRGFLAGIFDAEGSRSAHVMRFSNTDSFLIGLIERSLGRLHFDSVTEAPRVSADGRKPVVSVRVRGGLREHLRFFHATAPAISRKWNLEGGALKNPRAMRVVRIEPIGVRRLHDITTGTGDFIANGVLSHNCYARPTHEYLSFGAGTDFERRILVKTRAPALLREAFEKKSWQGELVVFSGVTDCYQPLEASYRLTRGCLEVCAEYGNPVGIITKSPLVERDIDVLTRLDRDAHVSVTISIPLWRVEHARAIEPGVTTPPRRMGIVRRLAEAGIPVGINVAPWIPGLVEDDLAAICEAARDAGARWAGTVLLRLPGSVAAVFEERMRQALPHKADKVLSRIRETHGGQLYDPRWLHRQRGDGPYAAAARRLFESTVKRYGLDATLWDEDRPTTFHRPGEQLRFSF